MKRNLFSNFKVIAVEKRTNKPPVLAPTEEVLDKLVEKKELTVEELLAEMVMGQETEDEVFERKCQKSFDRVYNSAKWKVRALIKAECSYYFSDDSSKTSRHYCPLRETELGSISKQCIYFEGNDDSENDGLEKKIKLYKSSSFDNTGVHGERCEHFEKHVLPLATELEVAYRKSRQLPVLNYFLRCKRCNKHFVSSMPRRRLLPKTQLCDKCKALPLVG